MDNFHLSRALAMLFDRERLKVRPPLARAPDPELAVGVTSDLVRKCAISRRFLCTLSMADLGEPWSEVVSSFNLALFFSRLLQRKGK